MGELYELELFAGAGGGILGGQLLGWRCIGAVERDDYCRRVLLQRQRDGILPVFPIWDDMRTFTSRNNNVRPFIKALRRVAHQLVIKAGFPCQPFSNAGKRLGADDDRNGWPWTIRSIREIRPAYALLENVPGLLTSGYFDTILGDLAACGYDANWRVLSAAELGAPHQRDRLWIVAYPNASIEGDRRLSIRPGRSCQAAPDIDGLGENVPDANRHRCGNGAIQPQCQPERGGAAHPGHDGTDGIVADAYGNGSQTGDTDQAAWEKGQANQPVYGGQNVAHANGQGYAEPGPIGSQQKIASTESCGHRGEWWAVEPDVGRVVNGLAFELDESGTDA